MPRFSNIPPHILQFEFLEEYSQERFEEIKKMSSVHKLSQKIDFSKAKKNSFYEYILNEYKKKEKIMRKSLKTVGTLHTHTQIHRL